MQSTWVLLLTTGPIFTESQQLPNYTYKGIVPDGHIWNKPCFPREISFWKERETKCTGARKEAIIYRRIADQGKTTIKAADNILDTWV